MNKTHQMYLLGIDAGGTHCRVRLENQQGELLGTGKSKTGHPIHGMQVVAENILSATDIALEQAGLRKGQYQHIVAAGGYAGAHLPRFVTALESWQSPFAAHFVTTDLHTACYGALTGEEGGVMIMGTGFSALANVADNTHMIGGQGFLLGDIACGGWLGLQAVKYALAYRDGMRPDSKVVDLVEATYNASGVELADKMIIAQPNEFARCAKDIFELAEQGDGYATSLIEQAVADASEVIAKLVLLGCKQIAVCGSVGQRLRQFMQSKTSRYLVNPQGTAEQGAIWLAKQQWQKRQGA